MKNSKTSVQKKFEDLYKNVDPTDPKQNDKELLRREKIAIAVNDSVADPDSHYNNKQYQKDRLKKLRKTMKDPKWKKNCKIGQKKLRQDPKWVDKWKKSIEKRTTQNSNWQKNVKEAARKKWDNPEYAKKQKQMIKERDGIPVQVKPPGKPWKTFICSSDASEYYGGLYIATYRLPKTGEIKTKSRGEFKGWQLRRASNGKD